MKGTFGRVCADKINKDNDQGSRDYRESCTFNRCFKKKKNQIIKIKKGFDGR